MKNILLRTFQLTISSLASNQIVQKVFSSLPVTNALFVSVALGGLFFIILLQGEAKRSETR